MKSKGTCCLHFSAELAAVSTILVLCTLSPASGLHHPHPKSAGARLPRGNETKGADSPVVEKHNHITPLFFPLLQVRLESESASYVHSLQKDTQEAGSPFELQCAHLAAQTGMKVCPRLQHTAVQIRSLRMRGAKWDLTVCRHMGACTRARTHTLTPQITSGMEKAATDWPTEPSFSLRGQGNFTRLFPSPHPPPPHFI